MMMKIDPIRLLFIYNSRCYLQGSKYVEPEKNTTPEWQKPYLVCINPTRERVIKAKLFDNQIKMHHCQYYCTSCYIVSGVPDQALPFLLLLKDEWCFCCDHQTNGSFSEIFRQLELFMLHLYKHYHNFSDCKSGSDVTVMTGQVAMLLVWRLGKRCFN